MINNKKVSAVLLVAGSSTRYGKNYNKNFEIINNKLVFLYSLDVFDKNKYVDEVIIAVKSDEEKSVINILRKESFNKPIRIVIGGNTRKESVYNCISNIDSDIVVIHDGARPLIKDSYVALCIENMNKYKGVTIGVRSKDTVKIVDDNDIIVDTTNRNNTWLIQTPQCFDRNSLLMAHEKFKNEKATDDCYLLEKCGYKVKVIEGDYINIKITNKEDLLIIKGIMNIY